MSKEIITTQFYLNDFKYIASYKDMNLKAYISGPVNSNKRLRYLISDGLFGTFVSITDIFKGEGHAILKRLNYVSHSFNAMKMVSTRSSILFLIWTFCVYPKVKQLVLLKN